MKGPQPKKAKKYKERKNIKMYGEDTMIHIVKVPVTEVNQIQDQREQGK
jgi:hypothetical protein